MKGTTRSIRLLIQSFIQFYDLDNDLNKYMQEN